jgi:Ran GTPase-activating protein (RanGAP) involved in mRNA processing and transport
MAIDNYLISNKRLKTLKLEGVKMTNDDFIELSETIEASKSLRTLDLSNNKLRNCGCREVASVLLQNKSL